MNRLQKISDDIKKVGVIGAAEHILVKLGIIERSTYIIRLAGYYDKLCERDLCSELAKWYKDLKGTELNLENPQTFDEKIQWMKIYDSTPLKTQLADKYLVRNYIGKMFGGGYKNLLVPLLGVWDSFDEIDFGELPDKFVLKANHGSRMNLIVKDKSRLNMAKTKKSVNEWMNTPFEYAYGFQMQYKNIPRKIIAEQYIEEMDGNLYDYKIHCFMGKPTYIQVIGDRDMENHTGFQSFFDTDWNLQDFTVGSYPLYGCKLPRPGKLDEMLGIAESLARGFQYVRVDLYCIGDNIKFGELTFTPASGVHPNWKPKETDMEWGKLMGEVVIKEHGRKLSLPIG